jgi:hypothetical protein
MSIPVILILPVALIMLICYLAYLKICDEVREFNKLEDELERQANESEKPHVEPLYRRRFKK